MHLKMLHIVVKFQTASYNTFWDMNYCSVWILVKSRRTDRKRCIRAHHAICTGGLKNVRRRLLDHNYKMKDGGGGWSESGTPQYVCKEGGCQKIFLSSPPCTLFFFGIVLISKSQRSYFSSSEGQATMASHLGRGNIRYHIGQFQH